MSSLVPGFQYDIFISYRHNDNRSGWVTEFVKTLQEELATTIKDPVSIYFDTNPHDGLLETHNVDKSLEGKLKCLIFIPIISQTYCDTKSFAWQHEFVAFNKLAKEDQFGRDIKLSNGNVTSRILPIKIHDIETEDKTIIESELGGVLRAIEFIYKSGGVNRPLNLKDDEVRIAGKILYKDQVNKVANAIKEINHALKNPATHSTTGNRKQTTSRSPSPKFSKKKITIASLTMLALILAAYFLYPKFTSRIKQEDVIDKSIAVLPFVNMSNDPEQEYFSDGISEEVLNLLAKVPELKVIGRTSSFYFKGKNEDLRVIGEKLGAAHILEGSVRKSGDQLRITAQLIRAEDGIHLWSETYNRKLEGIFELQDEIAAAVLEQLKLKLLGASTISSSSITSTEVYNLILKGNYFLDQRKLPKAYEYFYQALAIDSTNARIWANLAFLKILEGNGSFLKFNDNYLEAREMVEKVIKLDGNLADAYRIKGVIDMWYDFDWEAAEKNFTEALKLEPGNSNLLRNMAQLKRAQGRYHEANDLFLKSLSINPLNIITIASHANNLVNLGKEEEATRLLNAAFEFNKDAVNSTLVGLYLKTGKTDLALVHFNELPEGDKKIWASMVYLAIGDKEKVKLAESEMLTNLANKEIGSFDVAVCYAFMNRPAQALDYLEKAYREKFKMLGIKSNVFLDQLKGDKRYINILKRMNLPID